MAAVTGGSQKSRLWASSRIGSEEEKARSGEPGIRCRQTAEAHARDRRASKSAGRYRSTGAVSARNGQMPRRSSGSPCRSACERDSRWKSGAYS